MGNLPDSKTSGCRYIFGPVPSRRLGLSLGVDLAPRKTCSLDCVYCEVGPTTRRTSRRFQWHKTPELLAELASVLKERGEGLDFITLAGSGEPTLNLDIGKIIREIKKMTDIPVAVLTNGTLLHLADVRADLMAADVVIPSLDTVTPEVFEALNRPAPELNLDRIVEGLEIFRREYPGQFWLEILLVEGLNDRPEDLTRLKRVVDRLRPDRIQLNTVFRPPAHPPARPLSPERMAEIAAFFGPAAGASAHFNGGAKAGERRNLKGDILAVLERRPCTIQDLADALGVEQARMACLVKEAEAEGLIRLEKHQQSNFYRKAPRPE